MFNLKVRCHCSSFVWSASSSHYNNTCLLEVRSVSQHIPSVSTSKYSEWTVLVYDVLLTNEKPSVTHDLRLYESHHRKSPVQWIGLI